MIGYVVEHSHPPVVGVPELRAAAETQKDASAFQHPLFWRTELKPAGQLLVYHYRPVTRQFKKGEFAASGRFRERPANLVVVNIATERPQDAWFEHMGFGDLIA